MLSVNLQNFHQYWTDLYLQADAGEQMTSWSPSEHFFQSKIKKKN